MNEESRSAVICEFPKNWIENPVRAEIVKQPEDYRWSSIGYHVRTSNKDNFLSINFGLKEFGESNAEGRFRRYRRFVYETGAIDSGKGAPINAKRVVQERKRDFKLSRADRFKHRTRYFTDSGIIGSKEFVRKNFLRFKHLFQIFLTDAIKFTEKRRFQITSFNSPSDRLITTAKKICNFTYS